MRQSRRGPGGPSERGRGGGTHLWDPTPPTPHPAPPRQASATESRRRLSHFFFLSLSSLLLAAPPLTRGLLWAFSHKMRTQLIQAK